MVSPPIPESSSEKVWMPSKSRKESIFDLQKKRAKVEEGKKAELSSLPVHSPPFRSQRHLPPQKKQTP
jgi:hypothetical protein